jgi:17beta-estradiol 17-dehydrogenase/3alpha(17beta)-hydroxysteroid dehydrogenase (NAD+)
MSWLGLAGRRAVITGGASGIGRTTAMHFLKEGCAAVTIVDRDAAVVSAAVEEMAAELRRSEGGAPLASAADNLSGHACDVSSGEQVRETWAEIGASDVLCNCAGITKDGWLTRMDEQSWDDVMDVNLKGTFLMTQGFVVSRAGGIEGLKSAGAGGGGGGSGGGGGGAGSSGNGGSVINIGSIVGKMGNLGQANYTASKSGVVGFTKTAAKEFAQFDVRVNCILPGFIRTPMAEAVPEKVLAKMLGFIPMGRMGEPDEIAQMALFLGSGRSSYMTGNVFEVAGGMGM